MKRILIATFFFSIAVFSSGNEIVAKQEKTILVLFSLVPSTPAYRVLLDGIRQELNKELGDKYTLHVEYLETERYPKGGYPKERFDVYNQKYENVQLDLIICIGMDVIRTIKQFASEELLTNPTLSIDFDFSAFGYHTDMLLNNQTTVFPIRVEPSMTISTALSLFPNTKNVYVVTGVSNPDKIFLSITKETLKQFHGKYAISFLSELPMDDILKKVRDLPENSIILVPNFITDGHQVPYYNNESTRLISKAANAPVFTYSDTGLGFGSMGGYIISFKKVGQKSGEVAVKILRGVNPNSIRIPASSSYEYLFDWRELKRWNLVDSDLVPKGSTILFEETSFFHKYRFYVFAGMFFLVLQTLLIASLFLMIRRQRRMTNQLRVSENKYRELVREDRVLRIGQMAANLAHELNQPLTAILSTAQAGVRFIESGKMEPGLMKELFQNIAEDDKRTASILSSIRGMLKLEKREKEKVNLNSAVSELVQVFNSEAIEKHIHLDINLLDELVYVFADPIQIQQVLLNLLVNASDSVVKSGVEKKVIAITEFIRDHHVYISVHDNGEGIDESMTANLFKPFFTSKKDGFGIGLAISQSIIEDHQGKIWAENVPDGGASFSFMLKMLTDDQQ